MNPPELSKAIESAQAQGLLPDSLEPLPSTSSWPMLVLTALGAWITALPFLALGPVLLGMGNGTPSTAATFGMLLIAGATMILRARKLPLFLEQLSIVLLIVGIGLLALILMGELGPLGDRLAAGFVCLLALALSVLLPQPWLRLLLGILAAVAATYGLEGGVVELPQRLPVPVWVVFHLLLLMGLVMTAALLHQPPGARRAGAAAWAETAGNGWLLGALAGLAFWAIISCRNDHFMRSTTVQSLMISMGNEAPGTWRDTFARQCLCQAFSVFSALTAGVWLSRCWPELRQHWWLGMVLVLSALAALVPGLGACLLLTAWWIGTKHWRLGTIGAIVAAYLLGAYYYLLDLPLTYKAAVFIMSGMLLGLLAAWGLHRPTTLPLNTPGASSTTQAPLVRWGLILSAAITLVLVSANIWQKETLIRQGQTVFLALEPEDPRSLIQGDYMALNFLAMNPEESILEREVTPFHRPRLLFTLDHRGIASLQGLYSGQKLSANELFIEVLPLNGRWRLVTDAYFFKEGESERWAQAKFGEFRVDKNGRAILIGLRGQDLKALQEQPLPPLPNWLFEPETPSETPTEAEQRP